MKTKTKPVVSTTTLARMGVASSWGGVRPKRYNGQPEIAPKKEKQKKNRRKTEEKQKKNTISIYKKRTINKTKYKPSKKIG